MKRKVGSLIQLQESSDPQVSTNVPTLNTGRKWKPENALKLAENDVRVSNMIDTTPTGRSGLGCRKNKYSFDSPFKKQVSNEISKQQNQLLCAKATQQSLQGKWMRWQNFVQRDMSFNALFHTSPKLISFCLGVTFDTIGSPANLKCWGLAESDLCTLCEKRCTVNHVLTGCKVALASGRYRFCHDLVL